MQRRVEVLHQRIVAELALVFVVSVGDGKGDGNDDCSRFTNKCTVVAIEKACARHSAFEIEAFGAADAAGSADIRFLWATASGTCRRSARTHGQCESAVGIPQSEGARTLTTFHCLLTPTADYLALTVPWDATLGRRDRAHFDVRF